MSIREKVRKIKGYALDERLFTAFLITIVGIASYGLGRISVSQEGENTAAQSIRVVNQAIQATETITDTKTSDTNSDVIEGGYVASKNSNKYHLPWCGGAQRISEENKIFFATKEAAKKAGYTPAGNCKGI